MYDDDAPDDDDEEEDDDDDDDGGDDDSFRNHDDKCDACEKNVYVNAWFFPTTTCEEQDLRDLPKEPS